MARRHNKDAIAVARLCGAAVRVVRERRTVEEAVAELRSITDRSDLLADAAGTMLGGWIGARMQRLDGRSLLAAGYLVTAGADPDLIVESFERTRDSVGRRGPHASA